METDILLGNPVLLRQQLDLDETNIARVQACMEMFRVSESRLPPMREFASFDASTAFAESRCKHLARWLERISELSRTRGAQEETRDRLYEGVKLAAVLPVSSEMFRAMVALDQLRDALAGINEAWTSSFALTDDRSSNGIPARRWAPHFCEPYLEGQARWKEMRADFERAYLA